MRRFLLSSLYAGLLLPVLLLPVMALAADVDYDALPDDWEAVNSYNPAITDYGIAKTFSSDTSNLSHQCTITKGTVQCTGNNANGQTSVPAGITTAYALQLGSTWSCAATDTGTVCWGSGAPATVTPAYLQSFNDGGASFIFCAGYPNNGFYSYNNSLSCSVSSATTISCTNQTSSRRMGPSCQSDTYVNGYTYNTRGSIRYIVGSYGSGVCALTEFGAECFGGSVTMPGVFDADGDGVTGTADDLPLDASETLDTDKDSTGNNADTDDDNDLLPDVLDSCPLASNPGQEDLDGDLVGDVCDTDADGDSTPNSTDTDDDNDGVVDGSDGYPYNPAESVNTDGDSLGNNADTDDDNDGVQDVSDNCPLNANANQFDLDGDGQGNTCDTDDDNDGLADGSDTDDDNDGVADTADQCPLDPSGSLDRDADSLCDVSDVDDDNDTLMDFADNCPLSANPDQLDGDSDGVGDVCDEWPADVRYTLDTDRDTLPDNWESSHGRNPAVADYAINTSCQKDETGGACTPATSLAPSYYSLSSQRASCDSSEWAWIDQFYRYEPAINGVTAKRVTRSWTVSGSFCTTSYETIQNTSTIAADGLVQFVRTNANFCFIDRQGQHCYSYDGNALTPQAVTMVFDSDGDGISRPADADDLTALDTDSDGIADNADAYPDDSQAAGDADADGVDGFADNCPAIANANQANLDGDAWGDACDRDADSDGHYGSDDKFPLTAAASADNDNDGYADGWEAGCDATCQAASGLVLDNCPAVTNADQLNADGDAQGDVCDSDDDNDGIADVADNCLGIVNANQRDLDADGIGDVCDAQPTQVIKATAVAAGSAHACVLTSAGGVKCWGYNQSGQLGNSDTANQGVPVDVVGLTTGVTAITAGANHTCALTIAGGVKCWGYNYYGQLGNGTNTQSLVPVDVTGLVGGVVAITAGERHTCAITAPGAVKCWGNNGYGQLGDNTTTQSTVPVDVAGLGSSVASIDAGWRHTCVITSSGGAKCWGYNYDGQLGENSSYTQRTTPVDVLGLGNGVASIATGDNHTCAVMSAGGAKCWGDNSYGQLGDSTTIDRKAPVDVIGLDSGVASVDTGAAHTCTVTTSGAVLCWGYNYSGQLGDGTQVNRYTAVLVSGLDTGASGVSAGGSQTCAVTLAGGVKCWGANGSGQLGDKTLTNKSVPVLVVGLPGDTDGDGVAEHLENCVTVVNVDQLNTDGDARGDACDAYPDDPSRLGDQDNDSIEDAIDNCPGNANTDQLNTDGDAKGNGCDSDDDNDGVADITDKFPLNSAASVDGDLDGVPTSWNAACNAACQSGSGLTLDNCASISNADQLNTDGDTQGNACDSDDDNDGVADSSDALPLDATETLDNDADGTGNNADSDDDNDTVVDGSDNCPMAANTDQADTDGDGKGNLCDWPLNNRLLAAGQYHSCVLTSAGGVKCWGRNNYGQLGDGTTVDRSAPVDVVGLGSGVVAITAGTVHTCALTIAGSMKCWGWNSSGQLGNGSTTQGNTPVNVNGLSSGVAGISAGHYHTCALMNAGVVKCWGANGYGQLGNGTTTTISVPDYVAGFVAGGAVGIAAGGNSTCALTTAGGVKCWGTNDSGQLGDGSTTRRITPVDVVGLGSGVLGISAARNSHRCALMATGSVRCWGYNYQTQLGDGTQINRSVPVDVVGLGTAGGVVSAGNDHTCSLTSAGGLKCWGSNYNGQVGDGTTNNTRSVPTNVSGLGAGVVAVATGDLHTCALTNAGGVKCWGYNAYGQLGDGTLVQRSTPVSVSVLAYSDTDQDGLVDASDNCPANANADQLNTDGDSQGNACDSDDDNDSVPDASDAYPLNAAESVDTDNDGIGNNADFDDDNDGLPDVMDPLPLQVKFNLNASYKGSQLRDGNNVQ